MRSTGIRRIIAFGVDWFVIAAWGGLLFGAVMLLTGGHPDRPSGPWSAQAIGFVTMTVPVTLYFAFTEASRWKATLGKRLLGLIVVADGEHRLLLSRSVLRNAIKFVPWEFGHLVAQQAIYSGEAGFQAWVWAPAAISMAGPVLWTMTLLVSGRTPYDRWAGANVRLAVT